MERRITQDIPIEEIEFDEEIYPRSAPLWQKSHEYKEKMRMGIKFPNLVLAVWNNKKILIDGKHRLDAYKSLKTEKIKCDVYVGWNRRKMFEEAIRLNSLHGFALSPFDKRKIALKLRLMNYADKDIAQLIQVPMDNLTHFIEQRLVNTLTGDVVGESKIVKGSLKHLAGKTYTSQEVASIEEFQKGLSGLDQISLLDDVIRLLETKMIDSNNEEIAIRLKELKKLLKNY